MALEHEINVLEESYCISVLSGHLTLPNAPEIKPCAENSSAHTIPKETS